MSAIRKVFFIPFFTRICQKPMIKFIQNDLKLGQNPEMILK